MFIVDDSRTPQSVLNDAISERAGFRVVGCSSDARVSAEIIRRLMPDIVTIDLCMPYLDGAALLEMISDLKNVCKIVVSDQPSRNLRLSSRLIEAGASTCLSKSELIEDPAAFFRKVEAAAISLKTQAADQVSAGDTATARDCNDSASGIMETDFSLVSSHELARRRFLRRAGLANCTREQQYDIITKHVARITGFPICLLTFIDADTQWVKSSTGLNIESTPRNQAFCNHTIAQSGTFVIADAAKDARFDHNPLVTGGPMIRSYAGHPITIRDGVNVGALCVIDTRVRAVSKLVVNQLAGMSEVVAELISQRPVLAA